MTRSSARLLGRSPIAFGPLLMGAVLACLCGMAGCARNGEAPPPPVESQVEGFWLQPLARGGATPCGHGTHAWVWTLGRPGLGLVDAEGHSLGAELFDKGAEVVEVLPTVDPERAWVRVREALSANGTWVDAVYLVDHAGTARRLPFPTQELTLQVSEGHERLWALSSFNQKQLWIADAAGQVDTVDLSAVGQGWGLVRQVLPVGEGLEGWLVLDQSLYAVDLRARPQLCPRPFPVRQVQFLHSAGRPQRVWVLAEQPGKGQQLFLISREGKTLSAASLPSGVTAMYPARRPGTVWGISSSDEKGVQRSRLRLLDPEGKPVGAGAELEQLQALGRAPDGDVWLTGERSIAVLGEDGEERARSSEAEGLGGARLVPVSAEHAWAVTREGDVRLLSVKGRDITAGPALRTALASDTHLSAWDEHGAWLLSEDGTTLHRVTVEPEGLRASLVLEGVGMSEVRPIPGTGRVWISARPRGYLYGPASDVRGVRVGFAGETRLSTQLERDAGGKTSVQEKLEAGAPVVSLELDWPGRETAAEAGRTLRLELRAEDGEGELVGQGVRRLSDPEGVLFQWTAPPGSAERRYTATVMHDVENGTHLTATFRHVPFGVPLLDRIWVRTALACLAVTLLLLLPVLLLRPSTVSRRWLPLLTYAVSLVGAGGGELMGLVGSLRIHVPTVVGVVCAELVLGLALGVVSPAVFRRLIFTHPFSWAAAPLLRAPAFRRRFFATYVRQVRRRVDVAAAQANGEVYVELSSHVTEHAGPGVPASVSERTAEELATVLTRERAHLLIQCAGGRGKSALLRQLVRLSLERFEKQPASPLPVFIDPGSQDFESAAKESLKELGLPEGLRDALLESGDFFLVLDGLTESKLEPEALRRYLEREMGLHAPLLLSARPNETYRTAMAHAPRWMGVEPKRLDAAGLTRFQAAYPGADGQPVRFSESLQRICRGRAADGTYVPILVRLALRFGGGDVDSVINLYRAVFAGLLKKSPDDAATSEWLAFTEALCLGSYWEHRARLIVYRDSPEEAKLKPLLDAGLLVPADARPGPVPTHVRFFHDSMQSYLTARALYARDAGLERWDSLWRAAGEPGFAREQSDLMTEAGSELFQMCSYVFGHDARLKGELARHLELCADANDERLNKKDILEAVPEGLRPMLRKSSRTLGPGVLLREATRVCQEHGDGESLFMLYARIAPLAWPWRPDGTMPHESQTDAA